MKRFALTAIGPDRPGIIAAVTKALFEHDCNIEDSSMTSIEDEFSIILIGSMPPGGDASGLEKDLRKIERAMGLSIHFKELGSRAQEGPPGNHLITLHGADKAGIVYKTTELLARMEVNITELETKVIGSPPVYIMLIEAYIPEGANISLLEEELSALERTLGVTISIKPVEDAEVL
ncbi:MAG TPA: ACT domain-containing protein [Thermodesulfobacteriota bacterium]